MVFASCDIFGDGVLRISEVFEVSVALLENCDNTDLTKPMTVNLIENVFSTFKKTENFISVLSYMKSKHNVSQYTLKKQFKLL